jgi:azurin
MKSLRTCVCVAIVASITAGPLALAQTPAGQAQKPAPAAQKPAAPAAAARTIAIKGDDTMKYSVMEIVAKPGEQLRIRLTSAGTIPKEVMAHNFVLLNTGTDVNKFIMAAAMARDTAYIPAKSETQILAKTGLAGPGETVEVTFTAPKAPGKYQYVCSFAGHFQAGMAGWLIVK